METVFTCLSIILLDLLQLLSTFHSANGAYKSDTSYHSSQTPDQEYYEVSVASFYHRRKKRATTLIRGQHQEDIVLKFEAFQKNFTLDLKLNKELFSKDYIEKSIVHSDHHIHKPVNLISNHCYYHGTIQGSSHSMAAVSTCNNDVSGFVWDNGVTYHIESANEVIPGCIKVFQEVTSKTGKIYNCDTEEKRPKLYLNETATDTNRRDLLQRVRRSIHGPYDGNQNTRFVELFLVNDYRTFNQQGSDRKRLIRRSQDIANIVSLLYRPLNIYIALIGVEIWETTDQFPISPYANQSLESFLHYRKQRINPYHRNDNAQLITGQTFNDGVVGKAIKSSICTHRFSGGVDMDRNKITHVATTVAHELGHNFGMDHDNYSFCRCNQEKCIMAPTSGGTPSPSEWSSCSRRAVLESFELGMDYCLKNKPESLFEGPVCGNAFVEEGEECDCGLPEDCTSKCCNASTCKLKPNAKCATGKCCDQNTCKPKPPATLCRPAFEECDLAEFCNGESEYCPADIYLQDGMSCQDEKAYCYKGKCTTHTDQCKLLWGSTGRVSDPICFKHLNINGSKHGNCGYDWRTDSYKRCDKDDVMCGLLHCVHLNEKLMFWRETLAIATPATFLTKGREKYVCRSVILDVGLDMPDPGMAPDGAKCGDRKVCINHKCTPFSRLTIPSCPDCHGNGRCNSRGQCHCNEGYAPPLCNAPGHGGSIHSGPMKISEDNSVLIGMLVFFGLVVAICIIALIMYIHRARIRKWWNQQSANLKYRVPCLPLKKTTRGPPPSSPPPRGPPPKRTTTSVSTRTENVPAPRPSSPVPRQTNAKLKNGSVAVVISDPVLQDSTNNQPLEETAKVSVPKLNPLSRFKSKPKGDDSSAEENASSTSNLLARFRSKTREESPTPSSRPPQDSPKPTKPNVFSNFMFKSNDAVKTSSPIPSPKPAPKPAVKPNPTPAFQPSNPIVKKDSFNREISQPVLISTTDRRSKAFVKEPSFENKEDLQNIGRVPPPVPAHAPVRRQHSDRTNKGPPRPSSMPPQPNKDRSKSEQDPKSARKSVVDPGARSPPRPPPPSSHSSSANKPQGQRLNLNVNLRSTPQSNNIRESAFEDESPAPRVFFDKSKYKIDDQPPPLRKKLDKSLSSEAKGAKLSSTNAARTSLDMKKKPLAAKKPVSSSNPKPVGSKPYSGDSKISISKPIEVQSSTVNTDSRKAPKSDFSRNSDKKRSVKQDSVESTAPAEFDNACVASITAMFDNMDIGTSTFLDNDSPPGGSPIIRGSRTTSKQNNSDRPRPPPKPGSGSKVRSVNV